MYLVGLSFEFTITFIKWHCFQTNKFTEVRSELFSVFSDYEKQLCSDCRCEQIE